jgi:cytoskeletal protein CcmA (bactofilin family)
LADAAAHHEQEATPSTVIGSDIKIIGSIEASADLMIEGNVEGDVRCRNLILGEKGTIKGKVFSERARISGNIDGSIETGDLAIEASGMLSGEAIYARLKIATGGIIEGNLTCKREPEQKLKLVEPPIEKKIVIE